ncbi:MAG TPA: hypothetical protein VHM64_10645, partial [Candidatus Binatia bacterium]|nr:hypothetical protein [Candidatus Binatia bacterium]
ISRLAQILRPSQLANDEQYGLTTNWFMSYARLENMKMQISVMPAWIAGIQVRRMRPETSCQPGFQRSMLE